MTDRNFQNQDVLSLLFSRNYTDAKTQDFTAKISAKRELLRGRMIKVLKPSL